MIQPFSYPSAPREDIDYMVGLMSSVYPLSDALKEALYQHIGTLTLEKNTVLAQQGEYCHYIYFIMEGAVMGYSTHNRKRITTFITIENEFVSSINGLHGVAPAMETLLTVEPTRLLALRNEVMQELFKTHFDINFVFRVVIEQYYRDAQERSHIIRIGNATERYAYFMLTKPGYIDRLPAESVSSFLDVSPATLMRIKKQFETTALQKNAGESKFQEINDFINTHAVYADKNVSLSSLAKTLKIQPQALSLLINKHYHLNFADYINTLRISRIKEQILQAGGIKNFTIEALASEAGFSSRSSFYNAFKKLTGTTPLQYVQSLEF